MAVYKLENNYGNNNVLYNVHSKRDCFMKAKCPIHNKSDHFMRDFKQVFRFDAGFMERECEHGVGHPDPDDTFAPGIHGCDGCCTK